MIPSQIPPKIVDYFNNNQKDLCLALDLVQIFDGNKNQPSNEIKKQFKERFTRHLYGNARLFLAIMIIYSKFYNDKPKNLKLLKCLVISNRFNLDDISNRVKELQITDPNDIIKIAKIIAAYSDVLGAVDFINHFSEMNQSSKIEIIKYAAARNYKISKYIRDLKLEKESDRIEIAKVVAAHFPSTLTDYFKRYQIKDEDSLFEIAKIAVDQEYCYEYCFRIVHSFNITKQEHRTRIAEIAASRSGETVSKEFYDFGIESEKDRIRIAEIAALQGGERTSQYIGHYSISDENVRIKLAYIGVEKNPGAIAEYIDRYKISEENVRIDLAKKVALRKAYRLSSCLKNFNIQNEKALIEIAEIAIKNNPYFTSLYIENYNIQDVDALFKLYCTSCLLFPKSAKFISKYRLPFKEKAKPIDSEQLQTYFFKKFNVSTKEKAAIEKIFLSMNKIDEYKTRDKHIIWFFVSFISLYDKNRSLLEWLLQKGTLFSLNQIRGSELRFKILQILSNFSECDNEWHLRFQSYFPKKANLSKHCHIPLLFIALLNHDETDTLIQTIIKSRKLLRDYRFFMPLYTLLTELITTNDLYQGNHIVNILKLLFVNTDKFLTNIEAIHGILRLGHLSLLKKDALTTNEQIDSNFNAAFQKEIPIKEIDNFTNRFSKTIMQFRDKTALMRYMGSLRDLSESDQRQCIRLYCDFVTSLLDGTFLTKRYENSSHLDKIFSRQSKLKDLWIENQSYDFNDQIGWRAVETDDPCDLLLCGTEIPDSCQNVGGSSGNNKCLLAYLIDGKNKLLAIKDDKGVIRARAILRLLMDDKNKTPALFLEKFYPKNIDEKSEEALFRLAQLKRKKMGLRLYQIDTLQNCELKSYGSPAPYEYVDALRKITYGFFILKPNAVM